MVLQSIFAALLCMLLGVDKSTVVVDVGSSTGTFCVDAALIGESGDRDIGPLAVVG